MSTTTYFDSTLESQYKDEANTVQVDIGTTTFLGNGPQLYLKIEEKYVILDHETASKLCNALGAAGSYLGYGSSGEL